MRSQSVRPIEWLMSWYQSQCDGDWEHQHGVRTGTLDNPGWSLDVDLADTSQTGKSIPQTIIERSEDDWVFLEVKDDEFHARGGPGNLLEMIELFAAFIEGRHLP
jgi:hypothetical protein